MFNFIKSKVNKQLPQKNKVFDRRKYKRVKISQGIYYWIIDGNEPPICNYKKGTIIDLSEGGVKFLVYNEVLRKSDICVMFDVNDICEVFYGKILRIRTITHFPKVIELAVKFYRLDSPEFNKLHNFIEKISLLCTE